MAAPGKLMHYPRLGQHGWEVARYLSHLSAFGAQSAERTPLLAQNRKYRRKSMLVLRAPGAPPAPVSP
jgi:hypothetical protein